IRCTEEIAVRLHQASGIDPADSVKRFPKERGIPLYVDFSLVKTQVSRCFSWNARQTELRYAVDVTGGGRSSAMSRRMSATTFAIWNTPLPAVVFGPVIANGSFTSTPAVRFASTIAIAVRPEGRGRARSRARYQRYLPNLKCNFRQMPGQRRPVPKAPTDEIVSSIEPRFGPGPPNESRLSDH